MLSTHDLLVGAAALAMICAIAFILWGLYRKEPSSVWQSGSPTVTGWYAILYTRSIDEGIFYSASWWEGTWPKKAPLILRWAGPFKSSSEALSWTRSEGLLQV